MLFCSCYCCHALDTGKYSISYTDVSYKKRQDCESTYEKLINNVGIKSDEITEVRYFELIHVSSIIATRCKHYRCTKQQVKLRRQDF